MRVLPAGKDFGAAEMNAETETAYAVCALSDIPSRRAYGFDLVALDNEGCEQPWPIVVVRWGKHVFGYLNRCPHHGSRLDWERDRFLDDAGSRLMCGKHGALFDLATGDCVDGPCLGEGLQPVDVVVIDGDICVTGVTLAEDEDDEQEI